MANRNLLAWLHKLVRKGSEPLPCILNIFQKIWHLFSFSSRDEEIEGRSLSVWCTYASGWFEKVSAGKIWNPTI
jgi:hypothetical protein